MKLRFKDLPFILFVTAVLMTIMYILFTGSAMLKSIEAIANEEGVSVHYISDSEMDTLAVKCGFNYRVEGICLRNDEIYIRESDRWFYFILAHELGHHFQHKYGEDPTEMGAHGYAFELMFYSIEHNFSITEEVALF